jgi:HD-like signal output (HDOD) protein
MSEKEEWLLMEPPDRLLDRIKSGECLPALSPVATALIEMASDETTSAKDLVSLIEKDPALTVRLIRLGNSAFFQASVPVTTLQQAVVRVGFDRLRIMALSISLRDTFPMGKMGAIDFQKFWKISLYRAMVAKAVARRLKGINPEEAFTAALILEVGFLLFYSLFLKKNPSALSIELEPLEDLLAWERGRHGVDHRQVGEAALTHWRFPAHIVLCQRLWPTQSQLQQASPLSKLCHLVRVFSRVTFFDTDWFHGFHEMGDLAFGLDAQAMNGILLETFGHVDEIATALQFEVHKEKDLLALLESANRELSRISQTVSDCQAMDKEAGPPSLESIDHADQIVSQTLQAVAHEIRNPLMAVGGFARKLADSLDPNSRGGKYVQVVLEEAKRLEAVLLDMTRTRGDIPHPSSP